MNADSARKLTRSNNPEAVVRHTLMSKIRSAARMGNYDLRLGTTLSIKDTKYLKKLGYKVKLIDYKDGFVGGPTVSWEKK